METRPTKVRYLIIFFSFLAALINYADRSAISVASPAILKEFHFTPVEWGYILSAFFWTYSPFAFVGGLLNDRIGARNTYGIAMVFWSSFVGFTAVAWSFVSFFIIRLVFGIGEGPQVATVTKLVSNWFPKSGSAGPFAISQVGTTLGPVIATPVIVWVTLIWGWRASFLVLGVLGFVWSILWFLLAKDKPEQDKRVNVLELEYIKGTGLNEDSQKRYTVEDTGRKFWSYIKTPYVLSTGVCYFAYSWVLFLVLTWYPTYLVKAHHVSMKEMGSLATWPWIGGSIGILIGCYLGDHLVKHSKTGDQITGRKWVLAVAMFVVAFTFGISAFVTSPNLAVFLVTISMTFLLASGQYQPLIIAAVPDRLLGSVAGFIQFISTLAGIIAPILTGFFVEYMGSYNYAFYLGSILSGIGAILVVIFVRPSSLQSVSKSLHPTNHKNL